MINIQLNGETRQLPEQIDLRSLIDQLSLSDRRVAIEFNGSVVRRVDWPSIIVANGDRLEVVHFVGGG